MHALSLHSQSRYSEAAHVTASADDPDGRFLHLLAKFRVEQQRLWATGARALFAPGAASPRSCAPLLVIRAAAADTGGAFSGFLLALIACELGHAAAAVRELRASLDLFPLNISAVRLLASLVPTARDLPRALPAAPTARLLLLVEFAALTRNPIALQNLLQESDAAAPWRGTPFAVEALALLRLAERDYQGALAALGRLIPGLQRDTQLAALVRSAEASLDPAEATPRARLALVDTLAAVRDVKRLERFAAALDAEHPESVEAAAAHGTLLSLAGAHRAAAARFHAGLATHPRCAPLAMLLGHELVALAQARNAASAFRAAADLSIDFRCWQSLGHAYRLLGLRAHAERCFGRASELNPWDSRPWMALAAVRTGAQRVQALQMAAGVVEGESPDALFQLAQEVPRAARGRFYGATLAALWLHYASPSAPVVAAPCTLPERALQTLADEILPLVEAGAAPEFAPALLRDVAARLPAAMVAVREHMQAALETFPRELGNDSDDLEDDCRDLLDEFCLAELPELQLEQVDTIFPAPELDTGEQSEESEEIE